MVRQIGSQVLFHAYGSHAGSAAAVGDSEGLVQVDMHDVGAEVGRVRETHQGIHIGAVQVHLSAAIVHDAANLAYARLEHAVGGGISYHQRGQPVAVRLGLASEVVDIHVAVFVTAHHHHLETGHDRAGRVGAVGGGRDQADIALTLPLHRLVFAYHQQARVFTLGAGIRLHGKCGKAREFAQHALQIVKQLLVALGLVQRREGMHGVEFAVGQGLQLRGRVQFHGA